MGSSPPGKTTATTTTDLPPWLKPYSERYLEELFYGAFPGSHLEHKGTYGGQDQYRLVGGESAEYGGPLRTILGFSPEELAARGQFQRYLSSGLPEGFDLSRLDATERMLGETISGRYLDPSSNPWLRRTYDTAASAVGNQYRDVTAPARAARFAQAGALGGTADMSSELMADYGLGTNLSDLATAIYGGNYERERGRQLDAGQLAGSLAQLRAMIAQSGDALMMQRLATLLGMQESGRQLAQQQADVGYENELTKFEYPFKLLDILGNAVGVAGGRSSVESRTLPNPDTFNEGLAYGGLGIAGAAGLGLLGSRNGWWGTPPS